MTVKLDLQIPIATAQAIIDRVLPGRTVAAISSLYGGAISAVYEIAFAEAQAPLVLKVYPDALHWKMQKEVTVSALIEDRLSVPVPRILLADDTKSLVGLSYIVMSKLEGAILLRLEPTLTAEELSSAYAGMGRLLREFHNISMGAFGYIGPQGVWTAHASNEAYMSFQFDKKLKEFTDRGGASDIAQQVGTFVAGRSHLFKECTVPVLCHNDDHAGNVLVTEANGALALSGILDFENAVAGDPLMDVARTLWVTHYYAAERYELKRTALLAGYGAMERRNWFETIELYRLYYVVELWCWMAQIGNTGALANLALDMRRYSTD